MVTGEDVRSVRAMWEGTSQLSVLETAKGVKDGRRRYGTPRLLPKEMMLTKQPSLLPSSIGQVMSTTDVTDDFVELPLKPIVLQEGTEMSLDDGVRFLVGAGHLNWHEESGDGRTPHCAIVCVVM